MPKGLTETADEPPTEPPIPPLDELYPNPQGHEHCSAYCHLGAGHHYEAGYDTVHCWKPPVTQHAGCSFDLGGELSKHAHDCTTKPLAVPQLSKEVT